jgi:hypothetical protein
MRERDGRRQARAADLDAVVVEPVGERLHSSIFAEPPLGGPRRWSPIARA